jgi:integrase
LKPEMIYSNDGVKVEISDSTWKVPVYSNARRATTSYMCDWRQIQQMHIEKLMGLGKLLLEHKSTPTFMEYWYTLLHLTRFAVKSGMPDADFTLYTETEWGAFAEWLENTESRIGNKRLSLSTRRLYFQGFKTALDMAFHLGKYAVTETDVENIHSVLRRRFRDSNLLSAKRSADRSFTAEEREDFLAILREEWLSWKEWHANYGGNPEASDPPDLVTVVAAYLCWEETVRPAEINVMTAEDIDIENKRLFLHAPNKAEGWIEISPIAVALLKALISWGHGAREELQTNYLFVEPIPCPYALGSSQMRVRLRKLLKKYHDKYPIERFDLYLADGRRTLGSLLAAETQDDELVRLTMRHASLSTTSIYYIRQGKVALSKNVRNALRHYATRLSMAYNNVVVNPLKESSPDAVDILRRNPQNDTPYGSCTNDTVKEGACQSGIHCGECPKLIPMVSKIENFIAERDVYLKLAEESLDAGEDRTYENRMAHAGMLEGHILNIQRKVQRGE